MWLFIFWTHFLVDAYAFNLFSNLLSCTFKLLIQLYEVTISAWLATYQPPPPHPDPTI